MAETARTENENTRERPDTEQVSEHVDATNTLLADLSAKLQAASESAKTWSKPWRTSAKA